MVYFFRCIKIGFKWKVGVEVFFWLCEWGYGFWIMDEDFFFLCWFVYVFWYVFKFEILNVIFRRVFCEGSI